MKTTYMPYTLIKSTYDLSCGKEACRDPDDPNRLASPLVRVAYSWSSVKQNFFVYFFGFLECLFFRHVWIRNQRAAVASRRATNIATHLPNLATHLPNLATHLPNLATHLPSLATHLPN
jgi:hypothetical protein